jgi:hypothetical protein
VSDLSLIIDPGGTGDRPGINLQVFPSGSEPLNSRFNVGEPTYTTNRQIAAKGFDDKQDFTFSVKLELSDYYKLESLVHWSAAQKDARSDWEILIYNLAKPYSEVALTRSRYIVPGTPVINQIDVGNSYFRWVYWVAVQGELQINKATQKGVFFECDLSFYESTKLTSDLEV